MTKTLTKHRSNLETFTNRFTEILTLPEPIRTSRLQTLMSDMREVFDIPPVNNDLFNACNVRIMDLYRAVSRARNLRG